MRCMAFVSNWDFREWHSTYDLKKKLFNLVIGLCSGMVEALTEKKPSS